MGVAAAENIARGLIAHGLPADTPVAVVREGTLKTQETLFARLDDFPARLREAKIEPPALIVVGSVVGLHEKLRRPP